MEKWSQGLQRRLTKLEQKIESVLVMDLQNNASQSANSPFEPHHESQLIRTLSRELPEDLEDRTIILFSRLAIFFDVGILLEKENLNWKAQAYFEEGRMNPMLDHAMEVKGGPQITPLQIVKAPAIPFLKQLGIDQKIRNPEGLTAFLLRPHDQVSFLVMTRLAGPWLKNHMNEIHQEILKAFA